MIKSIIAVLCSVGLFSQPQPRQDVEPIPPTMNLSAIHSIGCELSDGTPYIGTGFVIGKNIVATANHIAENQKCFDQTVGVPLRMYRQDKRHDFALMVGKEDDAPYIRTTCERPKSGKIYVSYGITSYGYDWGHNIFRNNAIRATNQMVKDHDYVDGFEDSAGLRKFIGDIAPGMSGGPVVNPETGSVYAVNNAGGDDETDLFDLADTALCTGKWGQ